MPLSTLAYNENDREHKGFADDLGLLQGGVVKGTYTSDTMHAYYAGHEMKALGEEWVKGDKHLKKDCAGSGKTAHGRSRNRVIVRVSGGKLVEDWAAVWRHDDRIYKLSSGFFKQGKAMRDLIVKGK